MTERLAALIGKVKEKHGPGQTELGGKVMCKQCPWMFNPCDAIRVVEALEAALKPRGSDDRDQNTAAMIYGTGSASPEGEKVYASAIRAIRNYRLGLEQEALARAEEAMER